MPLSSQVLAPPGNVLNEDMPGMTFLVAHYFPLAEALRLDPDDPGTHSALS